MKKLIVFNFLGGVFFLGKAIKDADTVNVFAFSLLLAMMAGAYYLHSLPVSKKKLVTFEFD